MIRGIGTDITLISRVQDTFNNTGDLFLKRLLSPAEIEIFLKHKEVAPFLAGRWAAKEATAKALGTGIGAVCGFQDIEVLNNAQGAPYLDFSDKLKAYLEERGIRAAFISLSHDGDLAIATVVLEG